MQALFWLAHKHPAVTQSLDCPQCGLDHCLLARFCRGCRADLTRLEPPPEHIQMREVWRQESSDPIECLLANHSLVATPRLSSCLDLWSLRQPTLLKRLSLRHPVQTAALIDNLFVGLSGEQIEVIHLTPVLCGDACRYDRNQHFSGPGPLRSALAHDSQRMVWVAGDQLCCYRALPQGLKKAWHSALNPTPLGLCLHGPSVFVLTAQALLEFDASDGQLMATRPLPFEPLGLTSVADTLWIVGQQSELWRFQHGALSGVRVSPSGPCYNFQANRQHAVLCGGRHVQVLALRSGRLHTLELPQACVLRPLLGDHWALLASYEGMIYQLALEQEQPRVVQARRPFTSFEPTTVQPVLAGTRLLMAGPEGQLAQWSLAEIAQPSPTVLASP